jgi:hypothetical protein
VHDREDVTTDKTTDVASGQPQNSPSKVNDPLQKHKEGQKSREDSQQKVQTTTEGAIPEKSADEKKAKKRKKEKRGEDGQPKQSDATRETIARPELLTPDLDEKTAKKRKHKEKKVDAIAQLEPAARKVEQVKEKKKKKGKEAKASINEMVLAATEVGVAEDGAIGEKRKHRVSTEKDNDKRAKKKSRVR